MPVGAEVRPAMRALDAGHDVACHLYAESGGAAEHVAGGLTTEPRRATDDSLIEVLR